MGIIRNYLENARKHEQIFRNILRDLKEKGFVSSISPNATLEQIFQEYSTGNRYGRWTILDFKVGPSERPLEQLSKDEALFSSEDIACLSGYGRIAKYKIKSDNSVEFSSNISSWMS